jgi:hypothetical protein
MFNIPVDIPTNFHVFFPGWFSCGSVRLRCSLSLKTTIVDFFKAWRVQPRNYLLFACHSTNAVAQSVQDIRFVNYWYRGGREKKLGLKEEEKHASPVSATKIILEANVDAAKKTSKGSLNLFTDSLYIYEVPKSWLPEAVVISPTFPFLAVALR